MGDIQIEHAAAPTDEVRLLIGELDATLSKEYAPEQRHGLLLDAIFQPHAKLFVARLDGAAAGCGGVAFAAGYAEVKRMYVRDAMRGRGIAQALLHRIEAEARTRGIGLLMLETGDRQLAAIRLYLSAGFMPCAAFGDYAGMGQGAIATSLFYEKRLNSAPPSRHPR